MQHIVDRLERFQKRMGITGEYVDPTHFRFKGSKEYLAHLQNEGAKYGVYRTVESVTFGNGDIFTAHDVPLPKEKFVPVALEKPLYGYATLHD